MRNGVAGQGWAAIILTPMGLVSNARLGACEIVPLIGAGGMGEVYQARDTRLDRLVALKVITGGATADSDLRTRFEREARAISSLNHATIKTLPSISSSWSTSRVRAALEMENA